MRVRAIWLAAVVMVGWPAHADASPWLSTLLDGSLGGAYASGTTRFSWTAGFTAELLLGCEPVVGERDDPQNDTRVPFHMGPFAAVSAVSTKGQRTALEVSGGVSVMVWSHVGPSVATDIPWISRFVVVSAGPMLLLQPSQPNRLGARARVSLGQNDGRRYRMGGLYLELQVLPAASGQGGGTAGYLGVELDPSLILTAFTLGWIPPR